MINVRVMTNIWILLNRTTNYEIEESYYFYLVEYLENTV
jgi:hypothetical protein